MQQDAMKKAAAFVALDYVQQNTIVGIGTGSTVNYFIDALATIKHKIEGTVASSVASEQRLKAHGIPVFDLNSVNELHLYVDGADEVNEHGYLIKGLGGALVREKILTAAASQFICIADESKRVSLLGEKAPVPVEVIPMARGYVARQIVNIGGNPVYRQGFVSDNGNIILDVYNLKLTDPLQMERELNAITGVVDNGIFAAYVPHLVLIGHENGVSKLCVRDASTN